MAISSVSKKCIPGVFCIENMTLGIFIILFLVLAYLYYVFIVKVATQYSPSSSIVFVKETRPVLAPPMAPRRIVPNVILDPYGPPLRTDDMYFPSDSGDIRGIPINIQTRGLGMDYTQLGILTRGNSSDMILPLMGRRLTSGIDKWQYYTISNTGNMNTKLPISIKGRSCSGEYGCDCINNGDVVYVQGYNDIFNVTMYENSRFNYIPYI
jgi:hypothetical protein